MEEKVRGDSEYEVLFEEADAPEVSFYNNEKVPTLKVLESPYRNYNTINNDLTNLFDIVDEWWSSIT